MGDCCEEVVQFDLLDSSIQKIVNKAKAVRERAYCPYSKFSVGAALLCEDGAIIDGCNVENVSYGLTICAERSAICKAISQGQKIFKSIAICAEMKEKFVGPCGACRQVLAEFSLDMDIYLCKPNNEIVKTTVGKLLPLSFNPNWVSFSS
ncbi:cytidine deaminase-like [Daphnia carinata]|uniref:cytidine deaminase-like n=1 Tax=Daphnia carinata TaxID=120202 RepID=UPI00257E4B14|nr:cytidine deaminase-like [Daphnia carinata]